MGATIPRDRSAVPRLHWYQFSLRTLLIFLTLCAIACSWFATRKYHADQRTRAGEALNRLGGVLNEKPESHLGGPTFLMRVFNEVPPIESIRFQHDSVTDDDLWHLREFPETKNVMLLDVGITDAGLLHLHPLRELEGLQLRGSDITDAGLKHLKSLRSLKWLGLNDTLVTGEGLRDLQDAMPKTLISAETPHSRHLGIERAYRELVSSPPQTEGNPGGNNAVGRGGG